MRGQRNAARRIDQRRLVEIMNEKEDSLRVYRLAQPKEQFMKVYGVDTSVDFEGPLVL